MVPDSAEHTVVVHVTPGEILDDRWRIETRIGQGAMGSVFRGRDLEADEVVAIKILAPEHAKKPKVVARFEREAELMTTIRHPNIVHLFGHGRRGALPYIVMEYLEGMTLSEVLEHERGKLPLAETIAVVKQIASGLAFLHHYGLVHRDVKPQNIFLAARGRVCILDLGVVRDQANPGLTRPGAMVGTPYYMSPEQIQGLEDVVSVTNPAPPLSAISAALQAVINSDPGKTQLMTADATQVGLSMTDLPQVPVGDTGEDGGTRPQALPPDALVEGQLKVVLTASRGGKTVAPVSATVFVDKATVGPASKTYWLTPGMHVVRVTASGFRAVERLVEIVAGNVTTVRIELQG